MEWECHDREVSEPERGEGAGGNRGRILVPNRGTNHINKHVKNKWEPDFSPLKKENMERERIITKLAALE